METNTKHTAERIYDALDDIKKRLTRVEVLIESQPKCPDPGACIRVEKAGGEYNKRIMMLELAESRRLGERTMIGLLCTGLGIAVTSIVEFFRK